MKCTQSRCQREKAANANARRRTRGTRRRHAWRDKVHSAHLLLTDARSTAYPVGNTLYWFLFLRSYFFGWESIFDASFRLNFAQTVRVNELTSFCHFIIVSGKQSWSDLSHMCFLWPKTLGTLGMAQSLNCWQTPPPFPVQPRSQGFSLTLRLSWFLICQIYLKEGGWTVSLPPLPNTPGPPPRYIWNQDGR